MFVSGLYRLGAVLLQGEQADKRPDVYLSRKLFPREIQCSTTEKESPAITWALDTLRYSLLGKGFALETEHCALMGH